MLILDKLWYIRKRTTHYSLILSETNKENFMKKKSFILMALLLALVFSGCPNADGDGDIPQNQTEDITDPDIPDDPASETPQPDIEAETSFSLVSAEAGAVGAVITFPQNEEGTAWQVELTEGAGAWSNASFEIVTHSDRAELVIKDATLPIGVYSVRIRITGPDYQKEKILVFRVVTAPAEFIKAPVVGSRIISVNKNKLEISWDRRSGAAGYKVYIGKTENNAQAVLAADITGAENLTYELTRYPGEEAELPDGTNYWVWVKAYNASGETKFSPAKKRRTSDPIDKWFYSGKVADFDKYYPEGADVYSAGIAWDSATDWYSVMPEPDGGGVQFNYHGGDAGSQYDTNARIVYHARFDPEDTRRFTNGRNNMEKFGGQATQGVEVLTRNGDGVTQPYSGVFIYATTDAEGTYYLATYYYGAMARQVDYGFGAMDIPEVGDGKTGRRQNLLIYFGNTFGLVSAAGFGSGRARTMATAIDNFSVDYMNYHIAWVAVPFFRRDIAYGGHKAPAYPADANLGWFSRDE
jgi:hypothetical protein